MANVVKVTNGGLGVITGRLKGGANEPKYLAWGTGTTAADYTDTVLETARAEDRVEATTSQDTTTVAADTYKAVGTLVCAGTPAAITEVGLLTESVSGVLFLRGTFDAINLAVGDSIEFTIKTIFEQSA